eukprot:5106062-Amphidinium_carterae.1
MAYINVKPTCVKTEEFEESVDVDHLTETDRIKLFTDKSFSTTVKELSQYLVKDNAYAKYAYFAPAFTSE